MAGYSTYTSPIDRMGAIANVGGQIQQQKLQRQQAPAQQELLEQSISQNKQQSTLNDQAIGVNQRNIQKDEDLTLAQQGVNDSMALLNATDPSQRLSMLNQIENRMRGNGRAEAADAIANIARQPFEAQNRAFEGNLEAAEMNYGLKRPVAKDRKIIKNAAGQSFYEDTKQPVFEGEELDRKVVKGADGFNYYEDTQERVLPDVEQKTEGQSARDDKISDYMRLFNADEGMATLVADGKLETFENDGTGLITTVEPFTNRVINEYMPGYANVPVGGAVRSRVGPVANLWGQVLKTDITGWEASAKTGLQSSIGQFTGFRFAGEDLVKARKSFEIFNLDFVNALRQNPKFSEGERSSIEKAISVKPSTWKDQASFIDELAAVDKNMRIILSTTRAIAASNDMPKDARDAAQVKAYALESYLQDLNVPAWVRDEAKESDSTPEGIDPEDWKYYTPEQKALYDE